MIDIDKIAHLQSNDQNEDFRLYYQARAREISSFLLGYPTQGDIKKGSNKLVSNDKRLACQIG